MIRVSRFIWIAENESLRPSPQILLTVLLFIAIRLSVYSNELRSLNIADAFQSRKWTTTHYQSYDSRKLAALNRDSRYLIYPRNRDLYVSINYTGLIFFDLVWVETYYIFRLSTYLLFTSHLHGNFINHKYFSESFQSFNSTESAQINLDSEFMIYC